MGLAAAAVAFGSSAASSATQRPVPATPTLDRVPGTIVIAQAAISSAQLRRRLQRDGWSKITVDTNDRFPDQYVVQACRGADRFRLMVNRRGQFTQRLKLGRCSGASAGSGRVDDAPRAVSLNDVRTRLRSDGYRKIRFTDRTLPRYVAEACQRGRKFRLVINRRGQVRDRSRIGRCETVADNDSNTGTPGRPLAQIRDSLRNSGYRNIRFTDRQLPRYVAEACQRGRKFRLVINRRGQIRDRSRIGRCNADNAGGGQTAALSDIRDRLRRNGWSAIRFTDRSLPRYVAEACRRGNRFRIELNRRGNIRFRQRIGRCRGAEPIQQASLKPRDVRRVLRARGFNRIRFTDRSLPRYQAEACKRDRRFELTINRFGQITDRRRRGRCRSDDRAERVSLPEIRDLLKARRYYRIRFTDRELPGYAARACRNRNEFALRINRFGEVRSRRQVGSCVAPERGFFTEPRIRRRFDINLLRRQERIYADDCQDYFEDLLADNTINFAVASAQIEEDSFDLLEKLSFVASRCPGTSIDIAGHTDSDGSRASNQRLSERRALSVVRFLQRNDVPGSRVRAIGFGEERPIASNATASGRRANRRIEFVVNWDEG
ncbi:MAG: OmpA family protein [Pseudomonadota bacterium]